MTGNEQNLIDCYTNLDVRGRCASLCRPLPTHLPRSQRMCGNEKKEEMMYRVIVDVMHCQCCRAGKPAALVVVGLQIPVV
jgi:hypothetical protein